MRRILIFVQRLPVEMGKTFHSKNDFRKGRGTKHSLSRHPGGTRASGLRKDKKNRNESVRSDRDRFAAVEFQSSRMRAARRALTHSVRAAAKRETQRASEDSAKQAPQIASEESATPEPPASF